MKMSVQAQRPSLATSLAFAFLAAVNAPAFAGDPQINTATPYGMRRGTEAQWTITGAGLADAKEILFYEPGFTVKSLVAKGDDSLKVTVAAAPDCSLGLHAYRIRSLSGISNLRLFAVGHVPELDEVEPNNSFEKAQQVPLNVTISGVVQSEDSDYFAVQLKQGERLTVEMEGVRLGNSASNTFFDPFLAIYDAQLKELVRSDDASLFQQDCLCALIAPTDGVYFVQVRDVSFGGNATAVYRLHIGTFPRPTAAFPPGGRPGETVKVRWIGDLAGDFEQEITFPKDGGQHPALVAQDVHGIAPSPNLFRLADLPWLNEAEPNNELKTATSSPPVPLAVHGIIDHVGDTDFFRFAAKKGQVDVKVFARKPLRSPLDALLSVHNDKGGTIGGNDDTGGPDSYVRVTIPADGEYLISLRDQLKRGGPEFVYRVEITEAKPALVIRLPERRQYFPTTLVVPQNNHNAVMVSAQRQNFSGELALAMESLPPGVQVEMPPFTAGLNEIPVLFRAAEDASPAGALVGIVGKAADPKQSVSGKLDQRTMLVRGQNNVDVWGHNSDRMATVVAEAIPYSLEMAAPKAPLVRTGSIDLKVIARRAPGFTAPISLRLLYNPPGVASSGSIVIPENKTEAVVPLTANATAALGTWRLVMTGRTGTRDRGGNRAADDSQRCSTPFADLIVSEPYHKVSFAKASVEPGQETSIKVSVQKLRDFAGTAKAELVGLPANTTSEPMEFDAAATELVFPIKTTPGAKPGRYRTIVCVTKIPLEGDTITHTLGGGELRIDAPLK
jgi:hypothetical protein